MKEKDKMIISDLRTANNELIKEIYRLRKKIIKLEKKLNQNKINKEEKMLYLSR